MISTNKKPSVLFSSAPWYGVTICPLSTSLYLKAYMKEQGYEAYGIDINREVLLREPRSTYPVFREFFVTNYINQKYYKEVKEVIEFAVDRLLSYNTDYIVLNSRKYYNRISNRWLTFLIKQKRPSVKIVLTGNGNFGHVAEKNSLYVEELKSSGLIDHYIYGDAEEAMLHILQNDLPYPGVDNTNAIPLDNLDKYPYADYDDLNMDLYNAKAALIQDGRGCIAKCNFCSWPRLWPKFRHHSGKYLFGEMLNLYKKHGITYFRLFSKMINGSSTAHREMLKLLKKYNITHPDEPFIWSGYWSFKSRKSWTEEDWELMGHSTDFIMVGVENINEDIRKQMNKPKYDNEDIEFALAMGKKYKVKMSIAFIIGYPSETDEIREENMEWIRNHAHYADMPIRNITIGNTMAILPGTELDSMRDELNIIEDYNDPRQNSWYIPGVTDLDKRKQWYEEFYNEIDRLGYRTRKLSMRYHVRGNIGNDTLVLKDDISEWAVYEEEE